MALALAHYANNAVSSALFFVKEIRHTSIAFLRPITTPFVLISRRYGMPGTKPSLPVEVLLAAAAWKGSFLLNTGFAERVDRVRLEEEPEIGRTSAGGSLAVESAMMLPLRLYSTAAPVRDCK